MRLGLVPVLVFAMAPLCADPLDVILLAQDSPSTGLPLWRTDFSALRPDDRIGLITFAKAALTRVPLTEDRQEFAGAVRSVIFHPNPNRSGQAHLWDALEYACALFPDSGVGRKRVVILLFADPDNSSPATFESAGRGLIHTRATLSAAVVVKREPISPRDRQLQTPPMVGPSNVPVIEKTLMIPEATLAGIEKLAARTHGSVLREEWDLTKLIEQLRTR